MSEPQEDAPKDSQDQGADLEPVFFAEQPWNRPQKTPGSPGVIFFLERETGFEPATSTLARSHSTTELFPLEWILYKPGCSRCQVVSRLLAGRGRICIRSAPSFRFPDQT